MRVDFWGVRGSHNCWGKNKNAVGGNTSCVSVDTSQEALPLIFDAGSGLINLGEDLETKTGHYHIFITHPHLDHLLGLPFFKPLWNKENTITLYGPHNLENIISKIILSPPLFPVPFDQIPANISFETLKNKIFEEDKTNIETIDLNHPGGSRGYKVSSHEKSVCYITDHEAHNYDQTALIDFIQGTDLLIFDCMYDCHDLTNHQGWGHSSWKEACNIANSSDAKALALYHVSPNYTDTDLFRMEKEAQKEFKSTFLAREQKHFNV